jgi:two-component system cell cycle sensor histidine kinase/response regulator CckA
MEPKVDFVFALDWVTRESGTMPSEFHSPARSESRPRPICSAVAWIIALMLRPVCGQTNGEPLHDSTILTNITEIWTVPREDRDKPHRMQTEAVIYYFDREWDAFWGECGGVPTWLPFVGAPFAFHPGQRVAIDGFIIPSGDRFQWDKTQVRILEDGIKLKAVAMGGLTNDPMVYRSRLVIVEGLIDRYKEDATHITLNFLADGLAATVYILKNTNGATSQFKAGDIIRLKCVYAPQMDKDGKIGSLDLWVGEQSDVKVIKTLSDDARFTVPLTAISEITEDTPTNVLLHVEGTVRQHEPGKWVSIWDDTGQVTVQSRQTQPLRPGDRIEAVGYPFALGVQQYLQGAVYRMSALTNSSVSGGPRKLPLRLAEQIRDLGPAEAGRHLPVHLRAVVTWVHPQTPFVYVEDSSGGVRIANPKLAPDLVLKPGSIVTVDGVTSQGNYVSVVTNATLQRSGWFNLNFELEQLVSLEQALTGVEDGHWVEMRGYVREVTEFSGLRRLELTTSSGEFEVWVPSSRSLKYLEGSIVRVQGTCVALANARHQLTGIQLWVPESKFVLVEETETEDIFASPMRPLAGLRRFNMESSLNRRVRTSGVVVLHAPGRYLYVQDGMDAIFALSRQTNTLQTGDWVELVGFPGTVGQRFLLREAVYRRTAPGTEPKPVELPAVHSVNLDMEGLLARAEGVLLNSVEKEGESRLLIQTKESAFEVSLDIPIDQMEKGPALEVGSRLAVTGVYEVRNDEYGKPHSFLLRLRSWNDVQVLSPPPWWTFARLAWVMGGLLAIVLIVLIWSFLISRKNKLLREAQAELQLANDQLELRVEERTRELQEQVDAKERACTELAQAQQSLMLASRQAGMAEVATGVLHNVGNVLNSVNVSTGVLSERLRNCSVESVAKAAALLQKHQDELVRFLSDDPKGKALPGFLEKLAVVLIKDKRKMQAEIESLVKNIEHINVIVAMQQNYAKVGGVLEELDLKDLVEDAIQINSLALNRHGIYVRRDYHPAPCVRVDRHKVLQILVNLINNAKHALKEKVSDKQVVVAVYMANQDFVRITVNDNGIGIAPENLNRIFSQGFTTRKEGHGFGLHSGANTARQLGGSLTVQSKGLGHGATFILSIPVANSLTVPAPIDKGTISIETSVE